ncbi:hypothetical protein GCM10009105_23980 [Dokdonella soli]|uniref:Uncharacterized protein n=1 Tax=Dokdonella soli TaxID=529810 RepID=A0ABN1ILZ3_9GAMM
MTWSICASERSRRGCRDAKSSAARTRLLVVAPHDPVGVQGVQGPLRNKTAPHRQAPHKLRTLTPKPSPDGRGALWRRV